MSVHDEIARLLATAAEFGTALGNAIERVRAAALLDELTKLGNSAALDQLIDEMQQAAEPHDFIFGDLNGLKDLNDRENHLVGDAGIREAARQLQQVTDRLGGRAFRLGGDEFVLIAPELIRDALSKALTQAFESGLDFRFENKVRTIRASFGVHPLQEFDRRVAQSRAEFACGFSKSTAVVWMVWDEALTAPITKRWRCEKCGTSTKIEAAVGTVCATGEAACPMCGHPGGSFPVPGHATGETDGGVAGECDITSNPERAAPSA